VACGATPHNASQRSTTRCAQIDMVLASTPEQAAVSHVKPGAFEGADAKMTAVRRADRRAAARVTLAPRRRGAARRATAHGGLPQVLQAKLTPAQLRDMFLRGTRCDAAARPSRRLATVATAVTVAPYRTAVMVATVAAGFNGCNGW
jgi:hypothetical protein